MKQVWEYNDIWMGRIVYNDVYPRVLIAYDPEHSKFMLVSLCTGIQLRGDMDTWQLVDKLNEYGYKAVEGINT